MKLTKTRTITRLLATALSLLLVISAVPMLVGADGETGTDGKLLLKLSSLNADAVVTNNAGTTVSNFSNGGDMDAGRGADATGIYFAKNANNTRGVIGLDTGLELKQGVDYTIEFYARMTAPEKGGHFTFGFNTNASWTCESASFYFHSNGTILNTGNGKWNRNRYFQVDENGNIQVDEKGNKTGRYDLEGLSYFWKNPDYARFSIQLKNGIAAVYINGQLITRYDLTYTNYSGSAIKSVYETNVVRLVAGFSGVDNAFTNLSVGDKVADLKDISIYSGIVDVTPNITLKQLDGTTKVIAKTDTLPTTEGDKAVVWTGEDGALVTDLSALTSDTVLTAHDAGIPAVLGYQTGKKTETSYALRVIGGIYSAEGSKVGFKLTLKYKDGDTVKTGAKDLSGDTVYTSIAETEDKTVTAKTAQQLGAVYLFALAIEEIPLTAGQVDITVTPYWVIGDNTVEGATRSVSLVNGEPAADAVPLQ